MFNVWIKLNFWSGLGVIFWFNNFAFPWPPRSLYPLHWNYVNEGDIRGKWEHKKRYDCESLIPTAIHFKDASVRPSGFTQEISGKSILMLNRPLWSNTEERKADGYSKWKVEKYTQKLDFRCIVVVLCACMGMDSIISHMHLTCTCNANTTSKCIHFHNNLYKAQM